MGRSRWLGVLGGVRCGSRGLLDFGDYSVSSKTSNIFTGASKSADCAGPLKNFDKSFQCFGGTIAARPFGEASWSGGGFVLAFRGRGWSVVGFGGGCCRGTYSLRQ